MMKRGVVAISTTTASATSDVIDTGGWHYLTVLACCNAADATNASQAWETLEVYESTATDGANATAYIAGTTNSTQSTSQFAINDYNDTSTRRVSEINIDLRGRERYHYVKYKSHDDTAMDDVQVVYELSRGDIAPNSAAEAGAVDRGAF
jgi:hypothetical protein